MSFFSILVQNIKRFSFKSAHLHYILTFSRNYILSRQDFFPPFLYKFTTKDTKNKDKNYYLNEIYRLYGRGLYVSISQRLTVHFQTFPSHVSSSSSFHSALVRKENKKKKSSSHVCVEIREVAVVNTHSSHGKISFISHFLKKSKPDEDIASQLKLIFRHRRFEHLVSSRQNNVRLICYTIEFLCEDFKI